MKLVVKFDGTNYEVDIRPIDHIAYTDTARRHKWSLNPDDDKLTSVYFFSFAAMKRMGYIPGDMGWNSYLEKLDDVEPLESEGDDLSHP